MFSKTILFLFIMIIIASISEGLLRPCLERLLSCEVEAFVSLITSRPTFLQHSISKHGRLRKGQTTHLAELPRCLREGVQKWKLWLGPASSDSSHFSISDYKLKGNFWKVSPPLKHSYQTFDINAMATRIRRDHCIFMWRCQSVYNNRLRVQYRSTHILSYNHTLGHWWFMLLAKDIGDSLGKPIANHSCIVNALGEFHSYTYKELRSSIFRHLSVCESSVRDR